jgi:xylulokinase
MGNLFLGLDSSTQSLSGMVVDLDKNTVLYEHSINFDEHLTQYGTQHGVLENSNPSIVHSPPLMWVEALEMLMARMQKDGVDLGSVKAVSGSGQQHGTVYLNSSARHVLTHLNPNMSLTENLKGVFSRQTSPIWMDSSTNIECSEIEKACGGATALAELTGSVAFERFSGPQIRRFFKTEPENYKTTETIMLVSSFLASIISGQLTSIDYGDASGMNLMEIGKRCWSTVAVDATADSLGSKLLPPVSSGTVTGKVSNYFTEKYGLNPDADSVVWSGDNPNSLIGLGLIEPGICAISLGTSDTFFGVMAEKRVDPRGEGHLFVSPTNDYMSLICFKNGSLAREKIRDRFGLDWVTFGQEMEKVEKGNRNRVMLPYFEPEIVPKVLKPGVRRFGLDEDDVSGNCRAVVEAQMTSMNVHSEWMGIKPEKIYATGGASKDKAVLQVIADVNQCPVYSAELTNSAALGAAFRAAHAHINLQKKMSWLEIVDGITAPMRSLGAEPDNSAAEAYAELKKRYIECESKC